MRESLATHCSSTSYLRKNIPVLYVPLVQLTVLAIRTHGKVSVEIHHNEIYNAVPPSIQHFYSFLAQNTEKRGSKKGIPVVGSYPSVYYQDTCTVY